MAQGRTIGAAPTTDQGVRLESLCQAATDLVAFWRVGLATPRQARRAIQEAWAHAQLVLGPIDTEPLDSRRD